MTNNISIVIPAKNESAGLHKLLPTLVNLEKVAEVIVVNDGSTDETQETALSYGVKVFNHPYSKGNGASIKTGASAAIGSAIIFMDADGQHSASSIDALIAEYGKGYDLVIGARTTGSQANIGRALGNKIYNKLASWMTGEVIQDLTSGFRMVNRQKFMEFLFMLPNGFSYPTTSTMAFYRSGYSVSFVPIFAEKRLGRSHLKPFQDGIRFLLIIFKVATLYSPLKIFFPISISFFLGGAGYYLYSFLTAGRFTNMGALLFTTSVLVFLIGLVSEQITTLIYKR